MEIDIEMEIEKEKGKSSPPRLGRIRHNHLSPARPRSPLLAAQAAHLCSRTLAPPSAAVSPAPPVRRAHPLSLATALSLASGPRLSSPSSRP
jgi:hypothetical protein